LCHVAADRLHEKAANAFLKTLESPPRIHFNPALDRAAADPGNAAFPAVYGLNFAGEGRGMTGRWVLTSAIWRGGPEVARGPSGLMTCCCGKQRFRIRCGSVERQDKMDSGRLLQRLEKRIAASRAGGPPPQ